LGGGEGSEKGGEGRKGGKKRVRQGRRKAVDFGRKEWLTKHAGQRKLEQQTFLARRCYLARKLVAASTPSCSLARVTNRNRGVVPKQQPKVKALVDEEVSCISAEREAMPELLRLKGAPAAATAL